MKKLILVSGKIHTGKNQIAEYIQDELQMRNYQVSQDLFAKSLKDNCKEDFKNIQELLNNLAEELKANINTFIDTRELMVRPNLTSQIDKVLNKLRINDDNWYENKTDITRTLLQIFGTEIFRKRVDENYWVNQLKNRVIQSKKDFIIVTDVRFPNEITGMFHESFETITIRINRNINTNNQIASHASETSLDNWNEWNYLVENNGGLKDLYMTSKTIVQDLLNENQEDLGMFTQLSKSQLLKLGELNG